MPRREHNMNRNHNLDPNANSEPQSQPDTLSGRPGQVRPLFISLHLVNPLRKLANIFLAYFMQKYVAQNRAFC